MPPITYGPHARQRMRERKITEEDVRCALARQTGNRPGQPGTMWIEGHAVGGRILAVCVTLPDRRHVKTVAWLREGEDA
jgi:Domain of unknown function (DUF4258)